MQFGRSALVLAHQRLAILDLTPLGHQPMTHQRTGCRLVFNGEIYNFRRLRTELEREGEAFRSNSDTEVLLAGLVRHGPAYLCRLEGMYAFAFHDPGTQSLLLARDPVGIKPLYLSNTNDGQLVFSSEVRAILNTGLVPLDIDPHGLAGYLAYGAVQHPFTLHRSVRSLPPGTYQQFTATDAAWSANAPVQYWQYPDPTPQSGEGPAAQVRLLIREAVRDHLIADVPVGVFLSGGIDSTILAGIAAQESPRLRAFTVGFSDNNDISEMELAADTSRRFGLEHVPINLPADSAQTVFSEWLAATDQPSIDGLNTFAISRVVRREGIKVALSGLGADEVFGGYPSFRDVPRLVRLRSRVAWLPTSARRGLANALTVWKPRPVRRKLADMMAGGRHLSDLYFHRRRLLSASEMASLGSSAVSGLSDNFQLATELPRLPDDPVAAVARLESQFYQGNMLLRDTDVMSMVHGLEIRVPFLDRRLLEAVHAVPGSARLPPGAAGKHLLRQAFPDLLRPAITDRAKSGFTLPIDRWMLCPLRERCEHAMSACVERLGLPSTIVRRVWSDFEREPSGPQWTRALALVALGDYVMKMRMGAG